MKILLALITISILIPAPASAQKAYEAVKYKAKLNSSKFYFTLGNGYLGASKIESSSGSKPALYYPDSGVPDNKDQLTFHAKGHADYFIVNNIQETYQSLPKIMIGRYWTARRWRIIKFFLIR